MTMDRWGVDLENVIDDSHAKQDARARLAPKRDATKNNRSCIDVDNGSSLDLTFENPRYHGRHIRKTDFTCGTRQLLEV